MRGLGRVSRTLSSQSIAVGLVTIKSTQRYSRQKAKQTISKTEKKKRKTRYSNHC